MATSYPYNPARPQQYNDANAAGPSTGSSRRQASGDQYRSWEFSDRNYQGGQVAAEGDQFMDAVGDEDRGYADLLGFEPPPPRYAPQPPSLQSPYEHQQPFASQYSHRSPPAPDLLTPSRSYLPSNTGGTARNVDFGSPPRERLPSSASMSSMSATLGGRRAPAPAALDLSPRTERVVRETAAANESNRYSKLGGLGFGAPPTSQTEGRRIVTDPLWDQRATRPLPVPPQATHRPIPHHHPATDLPTSPSFPSGTVPPHRSSVAASQHRPSYSTASSAPQIPMSPSMPTTVPLSAVGYGRIGMREANISGPDRLSVMAEDSTRPSIDSYYTRVSSYGSTSLSPPPLAGSLSPSTPDPAQLDRRTLVGVGELTTPRWNSRTHAHLRTPSMPQDLGVSPPMPPPPDSLHVGSAPSRAWTRGENGHGLGVGVMEGVTEESPVKGRRHYSASLESPPRPSVRQSSRETHGSNTAPTASQGTFSGLLDLGSLGDFDFDSTMEAALAASLSIADNPAPSLPPAPKKASPQRQSAPPATNPTPRTEPSATSSNSPRGAVNPTTYENPASNVSPGSARSRIYARRAERERQASVAAQAQEPLIPTRALSHQSPPNSADSSVSAPRSARDARKTPPSSREGTLAKPRQSPGSAHHDILKHFTPKDFSHLPPSPSSASINQFLRGSGSINNFGSLDSRSPPASQNNIQNYFPSTTSVPTAASKSSLQRSESGRMKSMASGSKIGWEGREVNRDAEEALRKLDGLGSTPGKKGSGPKGKQSTSSSSITSRPGTPSGKKTSIPPGRRASQSSVKTLDHPLKENDSPLNTWVDLSEDVPAVPQPGRGRVAGPKTSTAPAETTNAVEKRESSSSTSFVGTPNSRDSHSLPTTSTTPSSASGVRPDRSGRRASASSDVSQPVELSSPATEAEKVGELHVPPVPPLPKGYMSMRQGLSNAAAGPIAFVPLHDPSPELHEVSSPSAPSINLPSSQSPAPAKPPMSKKWSFSSALSLKLHHKDSPSPGASPGLPETNDDGSHTPWTEILRQDLSTPSIVESSETISGPSEYYDAASDHSTTPNNNNNNLAAPAVGASGKSSTAHKRLTPSSIPFFRRASSSSIQSKSSQGTPPIAPQAPKAAPPTSYNNNVPAAPATQRTPSGTSTVTRKSMLGMTLPSMLRGSASKRGLSQQLAPPSQVPLQTQEKDKVLDIKAESKSASSSAGTGSLGWTGRKRGKVTLMMLILPSC
ncbi:hypothetical protein BCR39DRAFT_88836 [Naematelia encephala]|uniref:Uncharacterized protein n=1 Tax=Naematelia encephala TaxID=71784 RepID=A0A1Y2BA39_9TREE|nr:hypothetical protein BCR39DRAFT_88836 [Naematelia encephala]